MLRQARHEWFFFSYSAFAQCLLQRHSVGGYLKLRQHLAMLCTVSLFFIAGAVKAEQVRSVDVDHEDGRYRIRMLVSMDAEPQHVYAVITDYANLKAINPAIKSTVLRPSVEADVPRLETVIEVCVLWMCKDVHQVQNMYPSKPMRLRAVIDPEVSDLKYGVAKWRVWQCGELSCLDVDTTLEPRFWVPPVIGPWVMKRMLTQEARITSRGIERLARQTHSP